MKKELQNKNIKNKTTNKKQKANAKKSGVSKFNFFIETNQEIKKVSWPKRKYVATATFVIIVMVFLLSSFISLADIGFTRLARMIIG